MLHAISVDEKVQKHSYCQYFELFLINENGSIILSLATKYWETKKSDHILVAMFF